MVRGLFSFSTQRMLVALESSETKIRSKEIHKTHRGVGGLDFDNKIGWNFVALSTLISQSPWFMAQQKVLSPPQAAPEASPYTAWIRVRHDPRKSVLKRLWQKAVLQHEKYFLTETRPVVFLFCQEHYCTCCFYDNPQAAPRCFSAPLARTSGSQCGHSAWSWCFGLSDDWWMLIILMKDAQPIGPRIQLVLRQPTGQALVERPQRFITSNWSNRKAAWWHILVLM